MKHEDIRALSGALRRGLGQVQVLALREALTCPHSRVSACLERIAGAVGDILHDELEQGLDHIADRRDDMEDSPATLAAQTRNDERRGLVDA